MTLVECLEVAQAWEQASYQLGIIAFLIGFVVGRCMPWVAQYLRSKGIGKPLEKEQ